MIAWTVDKSFQILFIIFASWLLSDFVGFFGVVDGWLAFFIFTVFGSLFYLMLASLKVDCGGKAVLITGCDSGFGYQLAFHLDKMGFRVFACCLFANKGGEGSKQLQEQGSNKLHVIQLNVADEKEVQAAREAVDRLLPKEEFLWAIVNNAGLSTFGYVDWVPMSTYKRLADVNTFGVISVTKAFLPLLRKAKGRVVNVASMLGRMGVPMRSPYVVTKFAIEGFSDCLRAEMKPHQVDVILLEPGNFVAGTALMAGDYVERQGREMWESMNQEIRDLYGEESFNNQIETMKVYATVGDTDLTPVITAFEEALTQRFPQPRYQPMDLYYKTRIFVTTHFPEWLHDIIYAGLLSK